MAYPFAMMSSVMTKNIKNPRQEKLRDFRHRGKHPGYGIKKCGCCSPHYASDKRTARQQARLTLITCLKEEAE